MPPPSLLQRTHNTADRCAILGIHWVMMMTDPAVGPKPLLHKLWKVVTWRWRLQIAINAPFGVLWVADKTNPAVHAFDMSMLAAIHAEWMAPMMGLG